MVLLVDGGLLHRIDLNATTRWDSVKTAALLLFKNRINFRAFVSLIVVKRGSEFLDSINDITITTHRGIDGALLLAYRLLCFGFCRATIADSACLYFRTPLHSVSEKLTFPDASTHRFTVCDCAPEMPLVRTTMLNAAKVASMQISARALMTTSLNLANEHPICNFNFDALKRRDVGNRLPTQPIEAYRFRKIA